MSSIDQISSMFGKETEKLKNLIGNVESKPELTLHEIVETYYQIINTSSMIAMIKQLNHKELLDEISETEKMILEKFNSQTHPQILAYLSKSIQDTMSNLQSVNHDQSKEEIENSAKQFEELREKMSTKEFVEQYDKGLSK